MVNYRAPMSEHASATDAFARGSRAWAVFRVLWAIALAVLFIEGAVHHRDSTFGYLGGVTG
jgi:hypothetical protein